VAVDLWAAVDGWGGWLYAPTDEFAPWLRQDGTRQLVLADGASGTFVLASAGRGSGRTMLQIAGVGPAPFGTAWVPTAAPDAGTRAIRLPTPVAP
jgi:hypothetical protein